MGNSASSQGSSTGTHDGDVGSSISEEQHDWPLEQAADTPEIQSLQEMRKPYIYTAKINPFFMKLFFTSDINIVSECQLMFNFKLPSEQLAQRKDNFISRLHCV